MGPDGVNRMIRDIRIAEHWLGREELYIDPAVSAAKVKLERSIATNKALIPAILSRKRIFTCLVRATALSGRNEDKVGRPSGTEGDTA